MQRVLDNHTSILPPPGTELKPTFASSEGRVLEHTIDVMPVSAPPARGVIRMGPEDLKELKAQLEDFASRGLVRPSSSAYAAPVLLVKKKSGYKRMVVDYRLVNSRTIKARWPLPRADDIFDSMTGAKFFSKIDLASGFYQIRVRDSDCEKTAFSTKFGLFEYTVMPMGMSNSPSTFLRLMDSVLAPLAGKSVQCY